MAQILDLRHILTESTTDLRQPIGLERQLLESSHSTDDEVGLSMLHLLKVGSDAFVPLHLLDKTVLYVPLTAVLLIS
jgi:hypothetical protein